MGKVIFFNFHTTDNIMNLENIVFDMSSGSRPASIDGRTIVFKKPGNSGDGTFRGAILSYGQKLQKGVFDIL